MTYQRNTDKVRAFKKALVRAFFNMASQMPPVLTEDQIVQRALNILVEKTATLEAKICQDAPKVLFADSVSTSSTTILVGDLAKILRGNGLEIGANRLFERLRDEGFLIRRDGTDRNMPTQRAMDLGLFKIKETAISHSDGRVTISKTPKVTGKGQTYFVARYAPKSSLMAVGS
jgi:phage antirepressor YoqD-like protein